MITPIVIAQVSAIIILCIFIFIGLYSFKKNNSYSKYFLADKSLKYKENMMSYFARFTSLATVLSFFIIFSSREGVYIAIAPITVLLGVLLFNKLTKNFDERYTEKHSSIFSYLNEYYQDKFLSTLLLSFFVISMLLILLVELYVGVKALQVLLPIKNANLFSLLLIGFIVFSYVAFGGMRSIIATDKVQSYILLVFCIVTLVILFSKLPELQYSNFFPRKMISMDDLIFILPATLMLNIVFINLFLFPSLYSTWQIKFSSFSNNNFLKGNKMGGISVAIIWVIFIIIGLLLTQEFEHIPYDFDKLLILVSSSDNLLFSYLIFPLLVIASISALLSTADSNILPIIQMVYDKKYLEKRFSISIPVVITTSLFAMIFFLYYIMFIWLEFDFIKAMFSVFGFSIIATPIIMWAIIFPENKITSHKSFYFRASLLLGLSIHILLLSTGHLNNSISLIQIAPVIGFTFVFFMLLLKYKKVKKKYERIYK